MTKLDDFNAAWAKHLQESMNLPYDSWVKEFLVEPRSPATMAFDLGESEGVAVTTAIPPGQAMSLSPWQIEALSYPEFSSVRIERDRAFTGTKVVETPFAVERYEDWSNVRSPARAARRRKRGFPQRIVERERPCAFEIGGVLYMHPDLYREVYAQIGKRAQRGMDMTMYGALMGRMW